MKFFSTVFAPMTLGLGLVALAAPAQAEAPGLFYSWRSLDTSVTQCVTQAETAMVTVALDNINVEPTSVAGRTEDSTALFVCLDNGADTTVMVIVSGDDEEEAIEIREALKRAF
ncbi:MAG: hypothetical protein AAGF66_15190 [Cyanobacteria bacterium P01_H01_bin.119]